MFGEYVGMGTGDMIGYRNRGYGIGTGDME